MTRKLHFRWNSEACISSGFVIVAIGMLGAVGIGIAGFAWMAA
jgi:hypothetical protein